MPFVGEFFDIAEEQILKMGNMYLIENILKIGNPKRKLERVYLQERLIQTFLAGVVFIPPSKQTDNNKNNNNKNIPSIKWMAFTLVHIGVSAIHIHYHWNIQTTLNSSRTAWYKSFIGKGESSQVEVFRRM